MKYKFKIHLDDESDSFICTWLLEQQLNQTDQIGKYRFKTCYKVHMVQNVPPNVTWTHDFVHVVSNVPPTVTCTHHSVQ